MSMNQVTPRKPFWLGIAVALAALFPLSTTQLFAGGPVKFTSFDFPGATFTGAGGVNNDGEVVGLYELSDHVQHGFLKRGEAYSTIDYPGAASTFANWINDRGAITGQYTDQTGQGHGFSLIGNNFTTIDYPGAVSTSADAMNDEGDLVGTAIDTAGRFRGFLLRDGDFEQIDYPGALWTFATAISGHRIVGFYLDQDDLATFHFHGFSLQHGHFRPVDCPGAQRVFISGVNSRGQMTGSFFDADGAQHALLVRDDTCHIIDFPESSQDFAIGISNHGLVAGRYVDANNITHAFLRGRDNEDFDDGVGHRIISVVFKTDSPFGNSPPMSGPDPAATSANAMFGAANIWNNLKAEFALNINPSWSNLVDSTGTATDASLSINGTVGATDFWGFFPETRSPLQSPFLFWNSWNGGGGAFGPGESTTITWTLTGLRPATTYDMCIYGSFADTDRGFDMTIDSATMTVPTYNNAELPRPNCVLFRHIEADGQGTISGIGTGLGDSTMGTNEADWSGFQLVELTPRKRDRD